MSAPKPTAAGSFQSTPFPHLLVYALDRRLTGTLVLEASNGRKSALSLFSGAPVKAKTGDPVVFLGRLLLEMGAIDEPTHDRTLSRVAKERRRHGEILIEENALDAATLQAALAEQLARQVISMFTLPPETAYGYYEGADFLARWGGPENGAGEPLALLWRGLRVYVDPRVVEAAMARVGASRLKLHAASEPTRFQFSAEDRAVVDVLRARPHSLAELIATDLADTAAVKRIIYALIITRHLDVGGEPVGVGFGDDARDVPPIASEPAAAPVVDVRPRAAPADTLEDPEVSDFKRELRRRAEDKNQNYYEVLGVPKDAPAAAISAAYFQLAKRMHPDRLGPEYRDVKDIVTRVFARVSEAHQMLSDPARRAEYDELLKSGGGSAEEHEQVQRVLGAATAFQKAEVLLKKQNLAAAETEILRAVADDPTQGDYIALKVWILSQKPERLTAPLDDLIAELGQVIQREEHNERARWYRGQLLKRSGKDALAMKDFRWVLDRNPKHLDATREVRLYEMRKGPTPGPAARADRAGSTKRAEPKKESSLLGKFFKR